MRYIDSHGVEYETDKALLVWVNSHEKKWIPISAVIGNWSSEKCRIYIKKWFQPDDIYIQDTRHIPKKIEPKKHEVIDELKFHE